MVKKEENSDEFQIILPRTGRGVKEIASMFRGRRKQLEKAIKKLQTSPTNLRDKNIEKLNNPDLGQYTIRLSKGERLFYDVDVKNKIVYVLRVGPHDLYKLV